MSMYDFREKVALQHERPHVEQRWPRTIKKLLRRCWEASPDKRPSFKEILESHVLDEVLNVQYMLSDSYELRTINVCGTWGSSAGLHSWSERPILI